MIHLIYLAAGHARRYGSNKLLTVWGDQPLYRHGLDTLRAAIRGRGNCVLHLVTCWEEIAAYGAEQGIHTVPCPDSAGGVSYSIRAGIRACGTLDGEDYLLFCVADQPGLTAETVARLLDTAAERPLTACLRAGDTPGNPTLFSAILAEELCALEGDRGGRAVMRRHPQRHIDVICNAAELADVDVPGGAESI